MDRRHSISVEFLPHRQRVITLAGTADEAAAAIEMAKQLPDAWHVYHCTQSTSDDAWILETSLYRIPGREAWEPLVAARAPLATADSVQAQLLHCELTMQQASLAPSPLRVFVNALRVITCALCERSLSRPSSDIKCPDCEEARAMLHRLLANS